MSQHIERARLLLGQSRYEMAETELRQALLADPSDGDAHALLGLCLVEAERYDEATAEAEQAIHLAPDESFSHYCLSCVLIKRKRYREAMVAVEEAIRINPYWADAFGQKAALHLVQNQWQPALQAADEGLALDPEDVYCANLRAQALIKLGRRDEAGAVIESALSRDPENATSHANRGYSLLESGRPKEAMEHFREALRLEPESEWARMGIVEAMKARHFVYRIMLGFFLWMSRFSPRVQFALIIGLLFGSRILGAVINAIPALGPLYWPVMLSYVGFVLLTWIAVPLFNLILRTNRFGRMALSHEQIVASNWFGLTLLLAAGVFGWGAVTASGVIIFCSLLFAGMLIPVSAVFHCDAGWPRLCMAAMALGLAGLATTSLYLTTFGGDPEAGTRVFSWCVYGLVGSTWIGTALSAATVRK